jgi:hypothetical protein
MTGTGATGTSRPRGGLSEQQLERIGWALFLIMVGGLGLVPSGLAPEGTWLAGTGMILIGLNVVRHLKGVRVSHFSAGLGVIGLAVGFAAMAGVDLPLLPVLLAAVGLQTIYRVSLARRGTP